MISAPSPPIFLRFFGSLNSFSVHLSWILSFSFRRADLLLLTTRPRCPFARTCLTPAMKQRDPEMSLTAALAAAVPLLLFQWVWSNGKQSILIIASYNSLPELSSVCCDQRKSFREAAGPGICWLHHPPSSMGKDYFSHVLNFGNFQYLYLCCTGMKTENVFASVDLQHLRDQSLGHGFGRQKTNLFAFPLQRG